MAEKMRPVGVNFEKILQSLQGDVHEMKAEYEETCLPINDDNKRLHQFCERLEYVLNFRVREGSSFLSGRRDLWQYLCKCLANRRNIHDGLKIVKANTELKTSTGRLRCFVRYCLVHQCLGDVIQQCVDNQQVTQQFYLNGALTLNTKLLPTLLNCLYQLCDVTFDLPPSGHDLDVSWPTFTRLGGAGGVWRPPSRTLSLSSLYSHVSQLSEAVGVHSPSSPTMAPVGEDDPLRSPGPTLVTEDVSPEVAVLHHRLAVLEGDNALLQASCTTLQNQLDQFQNTETAVLHKSEKESQTECQISNKCHQCELLTDELRVSTSRCEELKDLQHRLEEQVVTLQTELDLYQAREKELDNEIKCLKEKFSEIGSRTSEKSVLSVIDTQSVPDLPVVTVMPEQTPVPDPVRLSDATDTSVSVQQVLEQCQCKLRDLENENRMLQEQLSATEIEKTTLRTNIRKISEVEEQLKQKVTALSERENEYDHLQEEVDVLKEKLEERGRLLHIASSRVTELETAIKARETSAKETEAQLSLANRQVSELESVHTELNQNYEHLKTEMEILNQQVADLRFQVSSKVMERDAAVKADEEKMEALNAATLQINEQEARINHLEHQAATDKKVWQTEQDKLSSRVNQLTQDLEEQNTQCTSMSDQLQQAEVKMKVTEGSLSDTQTELRTTQETSSQLTRDNEELREKVIQLLREKDALWQANLRLEAVAGRTRMWMDDNSAQKCLGCGITFSLTRRRHHCRTCGQIFCTGCSDNWIMTSASSRRVRVCDDCFSIQAELAAIVATPAHITSSSCQRSDDSEDTGIQASSSAKPLPITSSQPNDDDFAVISDNEVQSSRLSSSPSSGSPPSNTEVIPETRATADIITTSSLSTQPPTNVETWVGAGTRALVPVQLPKGIILQWSFISEPKCVSFSVLHQPSTLSTDQEAWEDEGCSGTQQRVLIPTTRVATTQGSTSRGRLLTKQPGVYTLVFDNSSSKYTAKKVTYSLKLEEQPCQKSTPQQATSPSSLSVP